jgi:mRNA-degrading endonuclease YafQ of YafQ-DinJ toxin-antitoxin module
MNLNIEYSKKFKDNFKKLAKKYKSISIDINTFIVELNKNPKI